MESSWKDVLIEIVVDGFFKYKLFYFPVLAPSPKQVQNNKK